MFKDDATLRYVLSKCRIKLCGAKDCPLDLCIAKVIIDVSAVTLDFHLHRLTTDRGSVVAANTEVAIYVPTKYVQKLC